MVNIVYKYILYCLAFCFLQIPFYQIYANSLTDAIPVESKFRCTASNPNVCKAVEQQVQAEGDDFRIKASEHLDQLIEHNKARCFELNDRFQMECIESYAQNVRDIQDLRNQCKALISEATGGQLAVCSSKENVDYSGFDRSKLASKKRMEEIILSLSEVHSNISQKREEIRTIINHCRQDRDQVEEVCAAAQLSPEEFQSSTYSHDYRSDHRLSQEVTRDDEKLLETRGFITHKSNETTENASSHESMTQQYVEPTVEYFHRELIPALVEIPRDDCDEGRVGAYAGSGRSNNCPPNPDPPNPAPPNPDPQDPVVNNDDPGAGGNNGNSAQKTSSNELGGSSVNSNYLDGLSYGGAPTSGMDHSAFGGNNASGVSNKLTKGSSPSSLPWPSQTNSNTNSRNSPAENGLNSHSKNFSGSSQGAFNAAGNPMGSTAGSFGALNLGGASSSGNTPINGQENTTVKRSGNKQVYSSKNISPSGAAQLRRSQKPTQGSTAAHFSDSAKSSTSKTKSKSKSKSKFDPNKYEPSEAAKKRALARATGKLISGHRRPSSAWPRDIHRHQDGSKMDVFSHMQIQYELQFSHP